VESVLRERGLEPRAADRLIENSRTTDGAVDLERLARQVEKVDHLKGEVSRQAKVRSDKAEGHATESLNHLRPGDPASAQDLVKRKLGEGEAVPKKVENAINQILEKAVVPEKKQEALPPFSPPVVERASLIKPLEQRLQESRRIPKKDVAQVDSTGVQSPARLKRAHDSSPSVNTSVKPNQALEREDQGSIAEPLSRVKKERVSGVQAESKVIGVQHQRLEAQAPEAFRQQVQRAQTQVIPAHVLEQVNRQISKVMPEGEKVVKLMLKPPELGYVTLHIDMKDNMLKLGMRTETSSAQELLISGASELKETLLAQGIKIEKMDVQIDDQLRQSFSFSQGAQGEELMERSNQRRNAPEMASLRESRDDPAAIKATAARNDHLIDVTA
jgi:flagellar hook-length control protein FliK